MLVEACLQNLRCRNFKYKIKQSTGNCECKEIIGTLYVILKLVGWLLGWLCRWTETQGVSVNVFINPKKLPCTLC